MLCFFGWRWWLPDVFESYAGKMPASKNQKMSAFWFSDFPNFDFLEPGAKENPIYQRIGNLKTRICEKIAEMSPHFSPISAGGPKAQEDWATPLVRPGLSGRNSGKIPERPRKRSQSFSWNSARDYGWDPPNTTIEGIWRLQSISRIPSPLSGLPNANANSQRFSNAISQIAPLPPVVALNRNVQSQIAAKYAAFWHAVPQIALASFLLCL